MSTSYLRLRFGVPSHLIDDFSGWLWCEHGPLGLEISDQGVDAYYEAGAAAAPGTLAADWRARGIDVLARESLEATDWLAGHRRATSPFSLGRGFWIDAREPRADVSAPRGRHLLRLPARRAFGTGSHESTRLAVAWLEELPLAGRRVLDVGAGSGVLSFVARRLGAARVVALERDLEAALLAGVNRDLNRVPAAIVAATIGALGRGDFDLVVVNVDPPHVLDDAAAIGELVARRGALVYSGALRARASAVLAAFAEAGLLVAGEKAEGEWGAWLLRRGEAS